ncbi:MAG: hypothetical protein Greene071421_94 [Parcubacteria group bacterium Greene0714_21]|nr:MAG: hypothetical protein Greene041639_257 [Parcubacteria group bacterium Greene0416_39]TSC97784.1 MAG: hypothetical protein Greene101447_320 [Parcubacteria group bacterium Greene1014_47]TSD04258.1 MAG: hypothetical protein Greene071421_94 [Parcubacteria group bacterium Greene0714_21]
MLTVADPKAVMREDLEVLQGYAFQMISRSIDLDGLSPRGREDLLKRMKEFFAIGISFGLTEKELTCLILKNYRDEKRIGCGCATCEAKLREKEE